MSGASSPPSKTDALKTAWTSLCSSMHTSAELQAKGWETLQLLSSQHDKLDQQEATSGQLAAVLYICACQMKEPVSVRDIVANLPMNLKDFFYHVEEQVTRLQPGASLAELGQLKRQYLCSTVNYRKYKDHFQILFPNGFVGNGDEQLVQVSFELGWLMFIFAKTRLLGSQGELMSIYHLLACVLHLLLAHLPEEAQTAAGFWAKLDKAVTPETYPLPAHAQSVLHKLLSAQPDEMSKFEKDGMLTLIEELRQIFRLPDVTPAAADGDGGGSGMVGLFKASSLRELHQLLTLKYDEVWPRQSQLDERILHAVQPPPRNLPKSVPASPCRPSTATSGSHCADAQLLTPLRTNSQSQSNLSVRGTPISSQLEALRWLKSAVQSFDADPGPGLRRYFEQCEPNPEASICERLERMCARVHRCLEDSDAVDDLAERCDYARRLYCKMLQSFLEAEEKRLHQSNFSSLLANESFHCSLFACCMEAVAASYSMSSMGFPTILDIIDLRAFDFYKVIESFIVHNEPRLPNQLRLHFAEVDAKILESLAWADDSPLHALMREYQLTQNGGNPEPPPPPAARAKLALEQFMRKVLHLAASRIQEMGMRLLLHSKLVTQVWSCMKQIIHSPSRSLLEGRHLDQLIMCTIYGVCKVNQKALTFRHIIEKYKQQPKASPKVFREVRMRTAEEKPEDIICFYNKIYIPAMKDELMRVHADAASAVGADELNAASSPRFNEAVSNQSPQQVTAHREVYISQPRTPSGSTMTPRTRTLYAFGNTPTEHLQHINHQLNCAPSSDRAAINSLRQLSSSTTPPSRQGAMPAPIGVPENGSRKRSAEGGMSRGRLRQRFEDQEKAVVDRSLSFGSTSSDAHETPGSEEQAS